MSFLENINSPEDVKKLSSEQLETLASEIRDEIISVTSKNGGHVSPNLGVVELSIALHRVFDTPKDKIVFDVSHQCYTHKLLTGRNGEEFKNIRLDNGLTGFCNIFESEHDAFGAGHAATAGSAALGLATARDLRGTDENVIAVIGDGVMTCGVTFEALNNISSHAKKLILVLNDNEMSIAKNVGAIASYLNELITNPVYNRIYKSTDSFLNKTSKSIANFTKKVSKGTKDFFLHSSLFEHFGLRYLGPIDGHNIPLLEQYLNFCKISDEPVLLHVVTKKGLGLEVAQKNPEKFHGASAYNTVTGESTEFNDPTIPTYQDAFGSAVLKMAKSDSEVLAITAAMASGTGLAKFKQELPKQFFDVGIAEEHAAIFAAGLARGGFKPVVAMYSSFMQRAFDCAMHDVCLQNLGVTFCMDRAGLSPQDGSTHHGLFDISFLRCLPNAIIMQPASEDELADMLFTATESRKPCFIRYPRGKAQGIPVKEKPELIEIGKAQEILTQDQSEISIWALGPMLPEASKIAKILEEQGIKASIVNARFAKPLDKDLLLTHACQNKLIVSMEDHIIRGGFGSAIAELLQEENVLKPLEIIAWADNFISHGSNVASIRQRHCLDTNSMAQQILNKYNKILNK